MAAQNNVTVVFNGNTVSLQQAISQMSSQLQQFGGQVNQAGNQGTNFGGVLGTLFKPLQMLGSAFGNVVGGMAGFIDHALQISTGIGLYSAFDAMISKAKEFGTEMFNLNETMERMQTSWAFLYGTGANAQSFALAQQMADWTKKESYFFPFTRQDMLGAINAAGMATQDPNLIEKYLPEIADIASVRTNMAGQPVTLQQAMYALTMANEGMSRMLKYDLKITPEDLKKYGWDEKSHDFQNLLDALGKYEQAHHLVGASKYIATHTWYGEFSSFMDRIQNFQLEAGHTMFKTLEGDLNSFTAWWDAHQNQLNAFADFLGRDLGDAVTAAGNAFRDFFAGWQNGPDNLLQQVIDPGNVTGGARRHVAKGHQDQELGPAITLFREIGAVAHAAAQDVGLFFQAFFSHGVLSGDMLIQPLQGIARWLNDPAVKAGITRIGAFLGELQAFTVGAGIQLLESFLSGLARTNVAQSILNFLGILETLGNASDVTVIVTTLGDFLGKLTGITATAGIDALTGFLTAVAAAKVDQSIMDLFTAVDNLASISGLPDIFTKIGNVLGIIAGTSLSQAASFITAIFTGIQNFLKSPQGAWAMDQLAHALDFMAQAFKDLKAALPPAFVDFLKSSLGYLAGAVLLTGILALASAIFIMALAVEALAKVVEWIVPRVGGLVQILTSFGIITTIVSLISNLTTSLQGLGTTIESSTILAFEGLMATLNTWWTNLQTWWNSLIDQALVWGFDLIYNLAQGVLNGLSVLSNAVQLAGNIIKRTLGHSVPTTGPLADEMLWMPHMMQNLATSMVASLPIVAAATNRVAATIGGPLQALGVPGVFGGGNTSTSVAYGNASSTHNYYGVPDAALRRMMDDERRRAEEYAHGSMAGPGGAARVFGFTG